MSIGLSKFGIASRPLLGTITRYLQQFRVDVNANHVSLRADLSGQADGGLTRSARQIEHLHAREGRSELNDGLSDARAHGRRLPAPSLRGGETKG
jgi:hypothetical protein